MADCKLFRLTSYFSVASATPQLTRFDIEYIAQHPNLNLTPEEKRVFYQLFQTADKTNLGVITGETAVSFFEKTNLAPEILGLVRRFSSIQDSRSDQSS